MNKEAILCVDDEAVILLALKQELKRRYRDRFLIETALNAAEANEVLRELAERGIATALVISDWFMPGTRGDQFLVELHAREASIRTILITGHADEQSIERARRDAGLCSCLTKPWRSTELFAAIDACLDNRLSESPDLAPPALEG